MKKKFLSALVALCIVLFAFVLPASEGIAQNNDEKYDSYVNMLPNTTGHAKYIVPNLYRQDASYINVKTFPLVVNGSVEYFPLDIFALYPYLQVVYSKITHGFYINNTKNNHYVAFDMETGTTTTHDEQLLDIKAQIFNRTYYVPAQKVCEILEMNFETYDDPVNGIRAARISDSKAKMTLPQLVTAYSPVKKDPEEENKNEDIKNPDVQNPDTSGTEQENTEGNNPPPDNDKGDGNDSDVAQPPDTKPVDPYTRIPGRELHLCFDVKNAEYTSNILDILKNDGITAVFFVKKDTILAMPDTIRRIIAEGHSAGISFDAVTTADDGQNSSLNDVIVQINEANDALYLVAKIKTRYILPISDYRYLSENGFPEIAKNNGYEVFDRSLVSRAYNAAGLEGLISDIAASRSTRLAVRFGTDRGTAGLVDALWAFTVKYPQFRISGTDEHTAEQMFSDN